MHITSKKKRRRQVSWVNGGHFSVLTNSDLWRFVLRLTPVNYFCIWLDSVTGDLLSLLIGDNLDYREKSETDFQRLIKGIWYYKKGKIFNFISWSIVAYCGLIESLQNNQNQVLAFSSQPSWIKLFDIYHMRSLLLPFALMKTSDDIFCLWCYDPYI